MQPSEVLQVSTIIAAGVVARPELKMTGPDAISTDEVAQHIVALAKALIAEAKKAE